MVEAPLKGVLVTAGATSSVVEVPVGVDVILTVVPKEDEERGVVLILSFRGQYVL